MNPKPCPTLSFVVPCYNEEAVLPATAETLSNTLQRLIEHKRVSVESAAYFIDDGSRDNTWKLIETFARTTSLFHGIGLSANRGHQNALLAGLLNVPGDIVISLDADLQDDILAVDGMLDKYAEGNCIVYGVRGSRERDTLFKRNTAELYYRLLRVIGIDLVFNHADFRLMSREAVEALREHREVNLFLRGLIPTLGFTTATVEYARGARTAGESKYSLWKMLSFAWNGITSFSSIPLKMITFLGITTAALSLFLILWVLYVRFFTDTAVPGWASITIPMVFLGGIQLISLGVIGEYLSKIYMETKARPRFIIDKEV